MRTWLTPRDWKDVWIAGVTSRTLHDDKHWLFYLAKVRDAYESHAELWKSLHLDQRKAKSATNNYLGDLYQPKSPMPSGEGRFSPDHYVGPKPGDHTHAEKKKPNGWQDDISYSLNGRHPALLVGDPNNTFIWTKPLINLKDNHSRGPNKYGSLKELLGRFEERS